jgi:predicted RNA-binding Zn-ribbon protein involved in translation (DUF1610 family)
MPIRFPCTACGQMLGIGTRKIGSTIQCPNCTQALVVPDEVTAKKLRHEQRQTKSASDQNTADTPFEIAITRDRHEQFVGEDLDEFLSTLDTKPKSVVKTEPTRPAIVKPTAPAATQSVAAPTSTKPVEKPTRSVDAGWDLTSSLLEVATTPPPPPQRPVPPPPPAIPTPPAIPVPPTAPRSSPVAPVPPALPALPKPVQPVSEQVETKPVTTPVSTTVTADLATHPEALTGGIWITRRLLIAQLFILITISLLTFLVGWIAGGSGERAATYNDGGPSQVRLNIVVEYKSGDQKLPDSGSAVLVWPKHKTAVQPLSIEGLSPFKSPPLVGSPAHKTFELLNGAYARTNKDGKVLNMILPEPGEYYCLVISRASKRPDDEAIDVQVLQLLGGLFGGETLNLLGQQRYDLKKFRLGNKEDSLLLIEIAATGK